MTYSSTQGTWQRVYGGFRRMAHTELGEEQCCASCHEFWPLDGEFYRVSSSSVSYECRACIAERKASQAR